jgi:hypothetical protein
VVKGPRHWDEAGPARAGRRLAGVHGHDIDDPLTSEAADRLTEYLKTEEAA